MHCYVVDADSDLGVTYNVGYYRPDGSFIELISMDSRANAMRLVNYLNGGAGHFFTDEQIEVLRGP